MRTRRGRFAPGFSGNPGGRPAIPEAVRVSARGNTLDALVVLRELMSTRSNPSVRLQATLAVLKLAWGGTPLDTEGGMGADDPWRSPSPAFEATHQVANDATEALPDSPALTRVLEAIAELEPDLRARLAVQINVGGQQVNVVAPSRLTDSDE